MTSSKYILFLLILVPLCLGAFETGKKPAKAAFMSLTLPGAGQYYNEKYTKGTIILLTQSFLIAATVYHHVETEKYYDKMQDAQKYHRPDLHAIYVNKFVSHWNDRQSYIWWLTSVSFLSMLDAYVDAHLFNFDAKKQELDLRLQAHSIILSYKF